MDRGETQKYSISKLITEEMVEELCELTPIDHEHLPEEVLLTEAFHRPLTDVRQAACFDTAFHHDLPRAALSLPIPRRYEHGIYADGRSAHESPLWRSRPPTGLVSGAQ